MSETKHTPGPWTFFQREDEGGTNYVHIRTTPNQSDGDTLHGYCGVANARLIVAAPDLLDALQSALDAAAEHGIDQHVPGCIDLPPGYDGSRCCWITQARAAIAKATGAATVEA